MVIQHNMAAANTNRQLGITGSAQAKSTEKLSSGYRINRAGDDAAGLSISEKMRGQIKGLEQASTNAQDGISLIQTAEGALNETHSILQRMRELTVQASNDTNTSVDRTAITEELGQLTNEVTRIATQTEFNKKVLMSGDYSATGSMITLQVGANGAQSIGFNISDMQASALSIDSVSSNVSAYSAATNQISVIDAAIAKVSSQRSTMGAMQNRLEHTIANADNTAENLTAAESRIRDVDMAKEMVTYSKNNILQQAAQSMLAQANQSTQGVLSLLR
ncbi:flagellin N-terminal helical domain-containing protein [Anaerocolumna chitinilytica]|jgi:flagellin|uniref:Flagellin n=1 Tax=Anaerocolumna chitinilytica TaxID=1727145 RepID=A0A7M3S9F8_9FIRM|nr:flagellin [Anaerocolumna chitinilytica]BCK01226.1 flagellin [Anaerocolumna chitinilytica]